VTADLLITGARVRTFDPEAPWAEAVGVTDGWITYVGAAADAPAASRRIDAAGRLITPGIIDSHNHLLLGFDEDAVSLEGTHDLAEVRRRINQFATGRPDLDWICAENAVYSIVEGRRPNATDLDGLTGKPIFVTTYDQHSVWLNRDAHPRHGRCGNPLTLDAIEQASRTNRTADRRHGIVHVECLHPDDLPRFRALGVTAAMQPRHCSPDLVAGTWMDNVGEQRWSHAWRFRSLLDSGATVAFSSDWQVGEMDPLVGVYSAATRAGLDGSAPWTPDERVGLDRALEAYTVHGARAWHAEHDRGKIAAGMLADLVVWSDDLYTHEREPEELLSQHAEVTLVGGAIVHSAGALSDRVGAALGEDPVSAGTAVSHVHCH
jgi:predicted amidohydrolase YtcJ